MLQFQFARIPRSVRFNGVFVGGCLCVGDLLRTRDFSIESIILILRINSNLYWHNMRWLWFMQVKFILDYLEVPTYIFFIFTYLKTEDIVVNVPQILRPK